MIKDFTVTIGDKDIKLTLKQAKELKKDLDELLEKKTEFLPINTWPVRPYYLDQVRDIRPLQPYYDDTGNPPFYDQIKITCETTAGGVTDGVRQ